MDIKDKVRLPAATLEEISAYIREELFSFEETGDTSTFLFALSNTMRSVCRLEASKG